MKRWIRTAALMLSALSMGAGSPPALAHDDATLDRMQAPHGGQLRAAGALHYELVLAPVGATGKSLPVAVYLTDHGGNKLPSEGATGTVTLLGQGQKTVIKLMPAGDNLLKGEGAYVPAPALKAIVSVTPKGQAAAQARFTPYASAATKPAEGHAGHDHGDHTGHRH